METIEYNLEQGFIKAENLLWESDWNGYEVGFDDISVVGLYRLKNSGVYMYVDAESGLILDMWEEEE